MATYSFEPIHDLFQSIEKRIKVSKSLILQSKRIVEQSKRQRLQFEAETQSYLQVMKLKK